MADFKVNIGKLDKRITIQKFSIYQNENGFDTEEWIDYKTVWSSINNLFGNEFYSAKAINEENTVEFVVRYSKTLEVLNSKEYRVFWNNKAFDIIFIDNVKYSNKWLKIKALEVV